MAQVISTLDPSELRKLIRESLDEALDARNGTPKLFDRTRLAQQLCCSVSHVDVLRDRGLPTIWVGDSPRFDLSEVLTWLRSNGE